MNPAMTETESDVSAIAQPLRWRYRTDDTDQWSFAHKADIAPPAYEEFCMLQIVREPWRYGAIVGIIMMLTGAFMLFVGGPRRRNNELD